MTGYEIYSLILCFMLLLFFVVVFGILLTLVVKGELKAIAFGQKDKEITTEYNKSKKPKTDEILFSQPFGRFSRYRTGKIMQLFSVATVPYR